MFFGLDELIEDGGAHLQFLGGALALLLVLQPRKRGEPLDFGVGSAGSDCIIDALDGVVVHFQTPFNRMRKALCAVFRASCRGRPVRLAASTTSSMASARLRSDCETISAKRSAPQNVRALR